LITIKLYLLDINARQNENKIKWFLTFRI